MEVLVVDGRSTDHTHEFVQEIVAAHRYPKTRSFRLLDNEQKSIGYGLNLGIREAKGEVVLRADGHAVYSSDYVSKCVEVLKETGAGSVGGIARPLPENGTVLAQAIALAHLSRFGLGGARFRVGEGYEGEVDTVWLGCWRREIFSQVGEFNVHYPRAEDIDFNSRLRQAGYKVWLSQKIRAWYFCRGTLRGLWKQNWNNGQEVMEILLLNCRAIGLRHLMPFLYMISLFSLGFLGFFFRPTWILLGMELGLYIGLSLLFSAQSVFHTNSMPVYPYASKVSVRPSNRLAMFTFLPLVFATLHFSYGLGSLTGSIKLLFLKRLCEKSFFLKGIHKIL